MKRSSARLLLAALAAVGVVALGYRFWLRDRPGAAASAQPTAGSVAVADGLVAAIYFPSTSGMLAPEPRTPPANLDRARRNLWLAQQLAAGPEIGGHRPALPEGTEVADVFAAPDGTVFVDFTVPGDAFGMGSTDEILAIYSVVNTLLLDNQTSDRVVLLLNGSQRETLAGHVDTSRPLAARPDLIGEAG